MGVLGLSGVMGLSATVSATSSGARRPNQTDARVNR
jgi:hypothetical protein